MVAIPVAACAIWTKDDATATSLTRERWLIPLLGILGFDDIEIIRASIAVGRVEYPISHAWQSHPCI